MKKNIEEATITIRLGDWGTRIRSAYVMLRYGTITFADWPITVEAEEEDDASAQEDY